MRREYVPKSASLGNTSDLTLLAPLLPGFVDALESVTYRTRTQRVLAALHAGRRTSHEYADARLLSDAVERVGVIQSVRVAVLEPQDQVLLAVSFDGPWEAYIRLLWEKVGTLLDLVFCGTQGYVVTHAHSFDEWLGWARRVQVRTDFFYGPPEFSAQDAWFHRRIHHMRQRTDPLAAADLPGARLQELRAVMPRAEEATARLLRPTKAAQGQPDEPALLPANDWRMLYERVRTGMQSVAALYKLVDLHRPGTADGDVLRRATVDLLHEFMQLDAKGLQDALGPQRARFARQIDWLFPALPQPGGPTPPELAPVHAVPVPVLAQVQGGVLRAYEAITHGAVLLFAFASPAAAALWLGQLQGKVTAGDALHQARAGDVFVNVGFTAQGLQALGLPPDALDQFPEEFRQGMAGRCSTLGDLRQNHPRRWRQPGRYVDLDSPAAEPVALEAVHAVLFLRCRMADASQAEAVDYRDPNFPLRPQVAQWATQGAQGVQLLAVQALRRRTQTGLDKVERVADHFGFVDGESQPQVEWDARSPERNHVPLGELLLGHPNQREQPQPGAFGDLWRNSSFLVVRKYRQFVGQLHKAVRTAAQPLRPPPGEDPEELVYAKLMGRYRNGMVLADASAGRRNNFDYESDPQGVRCPLHAHIRRANPRPADMHNQRFPWLMRRSMSYGPAVPPLDKAGLPDDVDQADRGLVFMAYNASLGEQFEVVQRWLVGGNSTGTASQTSCPIVGVPDSGLQRHYGFEHDNKPFDVTLDAPTPLLDEPQAPTRLEWGTYLFAPSLPALQQLCKCAEQAAAQRQVPAPWDLARGRQLLRQLQALQTTGDTAAARDAWKAAIEDPESIDRLDAAALWAAIRRDHGGLLRTAYGVLVAERALLTEVYTDAQQRYSVSGQFARMQQSFGEIALGLDDGPLYREQSHEINQAIGALRRSEVSTLAFDAATQAIDRLVEASKHQAAILGNPRFELVFDAREVLDEVLAELSEAWFGLQGGDGARHFKRGGQDLAWDGGKPLYPGHFTALSRYMFQPHPGPAVVALGQRYGRALRNAMLGMVGEHMDNHTLPQYKGHAAPLAEALFKHPTLGQDRGFVARAMVGVLMGFNPTIIGAVLNVLAQWRRHGQLAALRAMLNSLAPGPAGLALEQALQQATHMRPMPQVGWRTVRQAHRLGPAGPGGLDLALGELVVLAMVSGTQQSLEDGGDDGRLMFGGRRKAVPSPTHACPGYEAGMGAMLGVLRALLLHPLTPREGPAALTFVIDGKVDLPPAVPPAERAGPLPSGPLAELAHRWEAAKAGLVGANARVMVWGDSWLDYRSLASNYADLRDCLKLLGYQLVADDEFANFSTWGTIAGMAADARHSFRRRLKRELDGLHPPQVVLLSGGGNDSTRSALLGVLNPHGQGPVLDPGRTTLHVDGLLAAYRSVLTDLYENAFARHAGPQPLVLVHGYDHPIPAGQSRTPLIPKAYVREWLHDPFVAKGYTAGQDASGRPEIDLPVATHAMRELIDRLNAGLKQLAEGGEFPGLHYVDLRGTIAGFYPQQAQEGWDNDLHPREAMFQALTLRLHDVIVQARAVNQQP